ncbi:MAG: phosphatase PAP2 family protein, partial [Alistipes sp.]|nr:phosphatase PAP2 family protein [Alistipes sp.]
GAGRYGTVSAHAGTMSAIALMSWAVHRWMLLPMFFVALLISYSRIYLACHFPMDIALGFGLGLMVGAMMLLLYKFVTRRYLTPNIENK